MRAESALLQSEVHSLAKRSLWRAAPLCLLLLLWAPAQAHHGAKGWYAHGTSYAGPANTEAEACLAGEGMFKAMQAAQNPPPQHVMFSSNSRAFAHGICEVRGFESAPRGGVVRK